jgi:hypothetical protein
LENCCIWLVIYLNWVTLCKLQNFYPVYK